MGVALGRADVVARFAKSIRYEAASGRAGKLDVVGDVTVDDDAAILSDKVHELAEGPLDVLERAVVIEMVVLDIRDDGDVRPELQE